jgi:hypothetical protein
MEIHGHILDRTLLAQGSSVVFVRNKKTISVTLLNLGPML